ncbi:MAG: flagellar hook-basal body complex protein FliE [Rhizobiales bacterium]|nr:flagellar hook-basal body complex protein FliE [Hyphomicrobiales bacterium]
MTTPASFALGAYAKAAGMGGAQAGAGAGAAKTAAGGGFGDILEKAMGEVVDTGKNSERQMAAVTGTKQGNLVDVVTAVSEAEMTLQTVVTVRDKVISAYQEILRMPI